MVEYRATIISTWAPEEIFDYLSDFSKSQYWDPAVLEARKITDGPPTIGTQFELISKFFFAKVPLQYEIVELLAPRRIALPASKPTFSAEDVITIESSVNGSVINYAAILSFKFPFGLLSPAFKLIFSSVGAKAANGLRRELNGNI